MAEAEHKDEGGGVPGGLIVLIILILVILWLRQGGWERIKSHPINFGWQPASTTAVFPYAPNFQSIAPTVAVPGVRGPREPQGPQGPNPYAPQQ